MKHLLVVTFFLCSISVSAQDVIVKKDGSTILSKVLEVNVADIKYKKFSNQNGPTYSIEKKEIQSINYENGDIDKFEETTINLSHNNTISTNHNYKENEEDVLINNNTINDWNNKPFTYTGDVKKKEAKYQYRVLSVHKDSKVANRDAKIAVAHNTTYYEKFSGKKVLTTKMGLAFANNSDEIIYIDLANCFFRSGHSAKSYFVNSSTEITTGKNIGVGVNAGAITGAMGIGGVVGQIAKGVNVGGGKSSSTTVTTYSERIIAVAPHSVYKFPTANFYESEESSFPYLNNVKVGSVTNFDEPNSVNDTQWNIIVSYSYDQNFGKKKQLNMGLYISKAVGLPGIGWNGFLINTDRYFSYTNGEPDFYIYKTK